MDKPIIAEGEFISADKQPSVEQIAHEDREHVRFSLRQREQQDISFACDGITVTLIESHYLFNKKIGIANIKNVGLGGVGFISSSTLQPKQIIDIDLDGERFQIQIMRLEKINRKLNFVGARWTDKDEKRISYITTKIYNMSNYQL